MDKKNSPFLLHKIRARSFHGLVDEPLDIGLALNIEPFDPTTVLVGDNGSGKTTWLEAIAALVGTTVLPLNDSAPPLGGSHIVAEAVVQGRSVLLNTNRPEATQVHRSPRGRDTNDAQAPILAYYSTSTRGGWPKTLTANEFVAVASAVVTCIAGVEHIGCDVVRKEMLLTMRGRELPFSKLSEGLRSVIGLVADIAWRAAVLDQHHVADAPALAEGVALIDEIELHLHPKWQRHILADLRRTFPRLQFIVTTNSPFVIQSLCPGQLINLDSASNSKDLYADESPEDIAEKIMGVPVPQRSERRRAAAIVAEEYYALLDKLPGAGEAEVAHLRNRLDELLAPYTENQAFVILLERRRRIAEHRRDE